MRIDAETVNWLSRSTIVSLSISNCEFSQRGQSSFSNLDELVSLEITKANLSKQMFSEMMEMTQLSRVILSLCKFDPQHYRNFAKIRPRIIYFNPVSFLGVQGTRDARRPGSYSCEIEMVVPNSGADEAGVKPGDFILSVNDYPIRSFTELRMFISQFDIGETMNLTVRRKNEEIELQAVLGDNPNVVPK